MTRNDRRIARHYPNRHARFRLICFPHAGGGTLTFRDWWRFLPEDVEVCAVRLPGREDRYREEPCTDLALLTEDLLAALTCCTDIPYALLGHSTGSLLSYVCAREMARRQNGPQCLIVSARRAPHVASARPGLWKLSDGEIIQEMRRLGGTGEEVLTAPELIEMLIPPLRADLRINDSVLPFEPADRLTCPLTVFGGSADTEVTEAELADWGAYTTDRFRREIFDGGHFYFQENKHLFLWRVSTYLRGIRDQRNVNSGRGQDANRVTV